MDNSQKGKHSSISFKWNNLTNIALITFVSLLAYGLLIPWLGYYWDDWVFAWTIKFLGPAEFIPSFIPFRPFLGPIFALTTSVFGTSPIAWQLFNLVLRIGTGTASLWAFRKIWPQAKLQTLLAALFFVVFPGYNQQWVALTHSNQEMISLLCYLLSIGFMVKAVREQKTSLRSSIIAMIFAFIGLYPTEYFFGLEILRPFIILFTYREQAHPSQRKPLLGVALAWLPYLILWISNGLFLYLFHNSQYYDSYGIEVFSMSALLSPSFLLSTIQDFLNSFVLTGFASWAGTFSLFTKPLDQATTWIAMLLTVVTFCCLLIILTKKDQLEGDTKPQGSLSWQMILLGSIGILAGRLPSWAAGLPLKLEFSWDRFMVSMLVGASLFFIGLVDYFIHQNNKKIIFASLIIALSVGWQFTKANSFRREWNNLQEFFWQLSWRIPALEPGTLVVTHELPFVYSTDQSLTGPLNWIYAPVIEGKTLPYMMAYTKARLGSALLPALKPNLEVSADFRTMQFSSSTDHVLVLYWESPGCVRVLDETYASTETLPGASYMVTDAIFLSNTSQIITDNPAPILPKFLFGKEPEHSWCYYFEKAELARQVENWEEVAQLGDLAISQGHTALMPIENLVFIEGYAKMQRFNDAHLLTRQTAAENIDLVPAICSLWERVGAKTNDKSSIIEIQNELGCMN